MKKPKKYWTKERCKEEALKYKSRMCFKNNSSSAYKKSCDEKWLNEICSHMTRLRKHQGYWTKERCAEEALKYINKTEFNVNSKSAYLSAYKNKWLDDITKHMEILGTKYDRCVYVYEFNDNHAYIGITYNMNKRQINRDIDKTDQVTKYIEETNIIPIRKQLTEYINVNEAVKMEKYYVDKYKENDWVILNKAKTGSIGGNIIKWTYDNCLTEAKKYNRRADFKNESCGAYYSAIKNNWLDSITTHMDSYNKPKYKWDFETCLKYVELCDSKSEFIEKYKSGYNSAIRNKWIKLLYP